MRKLKIALTDLELIFDSSEPEMRSFLNLETGELVTPAITEDGEFYDLDDYSEYEDNDQLAEVPRQDSRQGYSEMEDFIDALSDRQLAEKLSIAIQGKGAFRRFKDVLSGYPEVEQQWYKFKNERLHERITEWLKELDVEIDTTST